VIGTVYDELYDWCLNFSYAKYRSAAEQGVRQAR